MNNESFIPSLLNEKIKVHPKNLHKNIDNVIYSLVVERNEGKCTKHGYIRKNSIKIVKTSVGRVEAHTLHGFVNYDVQFSASVCNPTNGSTLKCKIVNSNNFGILCCSGIEEDGQFVTILDIIVPKSSLNIRSDTEINLNSLKIGEYIFVEIVGKKFNINDSKISAVGKVVNIDNTQSINIGIDTPDDNDNTMFVDEDVYDDDVPIDDVPIELKKQEGGSDDEEDDVEQDEETPNDEQDENDDDEDGDEVDEVQDDNEEDDEDEEDDDEEDDDDDNDSTISTNVPTIMQKVLKT
jgi:DNA-directed RNA polymerase subunit E'/Rpb7